MTCEETTTRNAYSFSGEISGDHEFYQPVVKGWIFALEKVEYGWAIRLLNKDKTDLTSITPPYRFAPNPRDILGWHFRNIDNTTVSDGSVNAPRELRNFLFTDNPDLYQENNSYQYTEPPDEIGKGWLRIEDYGLADIEKGQKARVVYMEFSVCLIWPKSEEQIAYEKDFNRTEYYQRENDLFASCGIPAALELNAYVKPRIIEADIDGNGKTDTAAPVIRKSDGKKGIAICRNGNQFDAIGLDNDIPPALGKSYFDMMESWSVTGRKDIDEKHKHIFSSDSVDVLSVERIEKSKYYIYMTASGFKSFRVFRYVEP